MSAAEEHPSEGAPEWMVSYADMITIMMAFFVVMYAMAGTKDPKKQDPVMASMRRQFGRFVASPTGTRVPRSLNVAGVGDGSQKTPPVKPQGRLADALRAIDRWSVGGMLYFDEGASALTPQHERQLRVAVAELEGKRQKIEIRGHTSGRPLPDDSPLADQWDLSYARCRSVSKYLQQAGIDPRRVRVSIAAQHGPLAATHDRQSLEQNGRVEIFMLNEFLEDVAGGDHGPEAGHAKPHTDTGAHSSHGEEPPAADPPASNEHLEHHHDGH